ASFDYTDNSASAFTSGGIGLRAGHPSVYTSFSLEAIPEPGSLALLAGSGLLALRRRRAAS
ncbi:MAG: PEP-CTERM sorting domain-containing protein, partial [Verrucomicrobiales bacterium]